MKKQLIILVAGGYAQQVWWIVQRSGSHEIIGFLDETLQEDQMLYGLPVRNNLDSLVSMAAGPVELISAVGDIWVRHRWHEEFGMAYEFATVIDPTALVAPDAKIGKDVVVFAFSVCSTNAIVGDSTDINWHCVIAHDVQVGSFTDIALGVKMAGRSRVGDFCQLGTNVCLIPGTAVGNNSIIGAGAVVTKDIPEKVLALGVPAVVRKTS